MLTTADQLPSTSDSARAEEVAVIQWRAPVNFMDAIMAPTAAAKDAITVHASDSPWCVECPDCHGAQLACPDDRRFLCNECGNVAIGGNFRPVVWPKDRTKIEALLLVRPPEARNWQPGETLKFLRDENKERGVG